MPNLRHFDRIERIVRGFIDAHIGARFFTPPSINVHVRDAKLIRLTASSFCSLPPLVCSYYDRIADAAKNPDTVMSCIMDGMAQLHCSIPWEANQHAFSKPLKQHLMGVIEHKKCFVSIFPTRK